MPDLLHKLHFHHLYYFWMTVRSGSVSAAAEQLRLSQPTLSSQIKALEGTLGIKLLERRGRALAPTLAGRLAFRYAEDIFSLGRELVQELQGQAGHVDRLRVGAAMVVPKMVVHRLLAPLQLLETPPTLVLTEDRPDRLIADLALHEVDLVLSDAPIPPGLNVRAFNHLLGECDVSLLAAPPLVEEYGREFPCCLDGAPLLLPTAHAAIRSPLDRWLSAQGITPRVVLEVQDSALMKVYGQEAAGYFVVPSIVADEVCETYGVEEIGIIDVRDRFYAITLHRRITNPTIALIAGAAHETLIGRPSEGP